MLTVVGLIIAALGFFKFRQISAAIAQGKSWTPPPEAVTTVVAKQEDWPATLNAIGSVVAVHGVTLTADLPGIVDKIQFTSGQPVRAGQVLVSLDTRQEQAQLSAAKAQRDLAKLSFDRAKKLRDMEAIAQAEYDQSAAQLQQADAHVGEIEALISRKRVRTPFAGVSGIRQVNLGQYLSAGEPIVDVQSMDPVYVNFDVPQEDVAALRIGNSVSVAAESIAIERATGKITAINSMVDATTRNMQVQATFANPHARLRPGMFVQVQVTLKAGHSFVAIPSSAINYAPYGNSVFIVSDMKGPNGKTYRGVRQQFVKLGSMRGDQVAVAEGVKPGDEVVSSGVFKLRNGAGVIVNNEKQPSNNPSPKPADS
jgi:membrane fusion protein (multidrug efflux system)